MNKSITELNMRSEPSAWWASWVFKSGPLLFVSRSPQAPNIIIKKICDSAISPLEQNVRAFLEIQWTCGLPCVLSPRSGRCFYTLMEVMGPLNWPTCHSSSKDYTVVNMHRANYVGIPLSPEPLYAHLFLWPDQQTPAIYQSPARPHWCLLRKSQNVSRPGSSPPHESIHMHRSTEICQDMHPTVAPRWCLHRNRCLPQVSLTCYPKLVGRVSTNRVTSSWHTPFPSSPSIA